MLSFFRISLPCLLFCISCIPFVSGEYTERTVMPEYQETRLSDKQLVIHITPGDIIIHNLRDVTRYMGIGIPIDRYWAFFNEHFPEYVKDYSTFTEVRVRDVLSKSECKSRSLALQSDDLLMMELPEDGQTLMVEGQTPDFILFMKEFSVFRRETDPGRSVLRPEVPDEPDDVPGSLRPRTTREPQKEQEPEYDLRHTGVRFPKVIHQAVYTLWDNTEGRIVSYGEISVGRGGGDESPWEMNLMAMAKKIMEKSPFKN